MNTHHVYAKCSSGRDIYLRVEFSGTRYQCEVYIKNKVRQGGMTHFNFISTLDIHSAARRYV